MFLVSIMFLRGHFLEIILWFCWPRLSSIHYRAFYLNCYQTCIHGYAWYQTSGSSKKIPTLILNLFLMYPLIKKKGIVFPCASSFPVLDIKFTSYLHRKKGWKLRHFQAKKLSGWKELVMLISSQFSRFCLMNRGLYVIVYYPWIQFTKEMPRERRKIFVRDN